ncbi:MAG: glycosyl hydrolase [Anaerolineae bacterium]
MENAFLNPPREFSMAPFWFWNDALDEAEIVRQIADFEAHGVYGFVIHPRVGLPRDTGWMSDRMLYFMRVAVEEAKRREMFVILYDEGMYPSGSSSGQVVAENPIYQCRCLALEDAGRIDNSPHNLVAIAERANGQKIAIVDRPVDAVIRGLHYIGEGPEEDTPPAADILNPDATATFIHLVYDRYAEALGDHFGTTIRAIFTDEPGLLGRPRERNVWPGTMGILEHVSAYLGYDFTPHLPALWYDDGPDAERYREDYKRALAHRLETTYYRPLYDWCEAHGIALTGHPGRGDDIGYLRYFHIPGQDIVWRWLLPGPTALEGPESTQGKCSSSAARHLGRRRNSNECFGAYGHGFTWQEMKWLVDWLFVRGVNLLYPHAFFYSIRGPRKDERPPDVGPHSPWWDEYKPFADYVRRMSWLNTDSEHKCHIAILTESIDLPWAAAKICFQHQRDFNYLELRHLWEDAEVTPEGIFIAGMHYQAAILDGLTAISEEAKLALQILADAGRLIAWQSDPPPSVKSAQSVEDFLTAIDRLVPPDLVATPPAPDLRYRHVIKEGIHYYILTNEGLTPLSTTLSVSAAGHATWIDPLALTEIVADTPLNLTLEPYSLRILRITNSE